MNLLSEIKSENWINKAPEEKLGELTVIFFWNLSSRKSLNVVPFVNKIYDEIRSKNFQVIGIHSAEFDFEENLELLKDKLKKLGINWPVMIDEGKEIKNKLNQRNPMLYLLNKNADSIFEHFDDVFLEKFASKLLVESGRNSGKFYESDHVHTSSCVNPTNDLYFGYKKGAYKTEGGEFMDAISDFEFPQNIVSNSMQLSGKFLTTSEYVQSESKNCKVLINFSARRVDLVLENTLNHEVSLSIGGKKLDGEIQGRDIEGSIINYAEAGNCNLVLSEKVINENLQLALQEGVRLYKVEFSGCLRANHD